MIRFEQKLYLYLALALSIALPSFIVIALHFKKLAIKRFSDLEIFSKILSNKSPEKEILKLFLICLSVILLLIALSRPQVGTKMEKVKRKGIDIIIAIDTSSSMDAEDIKPSRLEKARHEMVELVNRLEGDRIGIIAFAGVSFLQCPLTLDYSAAKMFLDVIDTKLIPVPGTAMSDAISRARNTFNKREYKYKALIILTDGEAHEGNAVEEAKKASKEGIRIFTIGIGTRSGEPIPIKDSGERVSEYKKDRTGKLVMSKLDETTLEKIALLTNGKYYRATTGEIEIDKIYNEIKKMEQKTLVTKRFSHYEDRFQYPLFAALFLLVLEVLITDRKSHRGELAHPKW